MISSYANPAKFLKLIHYIKPILGLFLVFAIPYGVISALFLSPPDYQQGESVRLMYIHVPAAWLSLGVYTSMAIAAFMFLTYRHHLAALYCRAAAPLGIMFTLICLITGSLWGKAMWGTYWVWDARLTTMLILLFLYLGYWILKDAYEREELSQKMSSILLLIGVVNIPLIKYSVEWFQTLHQPASLKPFGNSSLHPEMLKPLLWMGSAFGACFILFVFWRIEILLLQKKNRRLIKRGDK